jgi:hypothetical protein
MRMRTLILSLAVAAPCIAQDGRVRAGQVPPWPPERGTVKFIADPPPFRILPNQSPLERLCDWSDLVIDGLVTATFPSRSPSRGTLQTDFLISVTQVLKGSATLRQIMVSQMGGNIGDFHLVTDQYALMQPGERYILFLQRDDRPSTPQRPGIPPYYVTRSWAGLARVVDGRIQLGNTAPGELTTYDGVTAESLRSEIATAVSRPVQH